MINTPTEDEEDLDATFSLADEIRATKYVFAVTAPLLGTDLYDKYVQPRLTRDEYKICGERRVYQEIADPRFRLARHKRNMGLLYVKARMKYMIIGEYLDSLFWFWRNRAFYKRSQRYAAYRAGLLAIYFNKTFGLLGNVAKRALTNLRGAGHNGYKGTEDGMRERSQQAFGRKDGIHVS
jgi:hypothetical protein